MSKNRWPGVYRRGDLWAYRAQFLEGDERWGISGSGFGTAREAWEARNEALKKAKSTRHKEVRPDNQVTLAEYLQSWIADHALTVRPSTASGYRSRVDSICQHPFASKRLRSLTEPQYRQIAAWLGEGVSYGTQMLKMQTLRTALTAAVRQGILTDNPTLAIRVSRTKPRFEGQAWDQETALKFLAHHRAALDPLYALWHLALVTGLRRGELHGLRQEDFDLDKSVLYVRRQRTEVRGQIIEGPTKTEGSQGVVYLDQETCDIVRRHTWVSDYFVTNPRTRRPYEHMGTFLDHWRRACVNADVPVIRFHDVRHTTASLLAAAGVSLSGAQRHLRHWSPQMTARYTHVQDTVAAQVADRIGAVLRNPAA